MNIKIQINPDRTTTIDGMMTFGSTDGGQLVLDFKASEQNVDILPFTATCRVQALRDGNVYITQLAHPSVKRNHREFDGRYITVTRRDDGSLRPNFKPVVMGPDFNIAAYASEVANELLWALSSLVAK